MRSDIVPLSCGSSSYHPRTAPPRPETYHRSGPRRRSTPSVRYHLTPSSAARLRVVPAAAAWMRASPPPMPSVTAVATSGRSLTTTSAGRPSTCVRRKAGTPRSYRQETKRKPSAASVRGIGRQQSVVGTAHELRVFRGVAVDRLEDEGAAVGEVYAVAAPGLAAK